MIFWLGIILALAGAFLASKKGLYEMWSLLFNIIISVYLGLTFGPVMKGLMGIDFVGSEVLVIFGTAAVCLTVLYGASYIIFLSQFHVTFPKMLDMIGGGVLGFLTTLLAWSFIAFLICVSPLGQYNILNKVDFNSTSLSGTFSYMKWFPGIVHSMVAADQKQDSLEQKVAAMIEESNKPRRKRTSPEPVKPVEPVKEEIIEEKIKPSDLGPPPQLDFEDN